jgi:glutaredoxin
MAKKTLIMYSRTYGCPFVSTAKRVLSEHGVKYTEIYIDEDSTAKQRVLDWTGFESVPTLVVTENGKLLPEETPSPLEPGSSPRGIDRGAMLTEPSGPQLKTWLEKHGFVTES